MQPTQTNGETQRRNARARLKYRAIVAGSDQQKTVEVGAAWTTAKANVLSVRLKEPATSFILVPNEPKPRTAKAPMDTLDV